MTLISVKDRSGQERSIDANNGLNLMETIRDSGMDEMLALCGGCLSCATCHVHIEPEFLHLLPPMSDDERDLLGGSDHKDERSRLSCQIVIDDTLQGLKLAIAPED